MSGAKVIVIDAFTMTILSPRHFSYKTISLDTHADLDKVILESKVIKDQRKEFSNERP